MSGSKFVYTQMISIIICSRSSKAIERVGANVDETISTPYEIIPIDNSDGRYGICEAYNIGAAKAKYELLCFMHEDIQFHTLGWGKIVADILAKSNVGVLGVAGGLHQPKAPAGWAGAGWHFIRMHVMHTSNDESRVDYFNPGDKKLIKAATLDGLWLCCRKQVWKEFKFDAAAFPAFHFYDIDFCTRVSTKYENYITFDILIEHFSHGTFDKVWMHQAIQFYKKRKAYLPFGVEQMTVTERKFLNLKTMQAFTLQIMQNGLPKKDVLFCLTECLKLSPLNRDNLYLVKQYLSLK